MEAGGGRGSSGGGVLTLAPSHTLHSRSPSPNNNKSQLSPAACPGSLCAFGSSVVPPVNRIQPTMPSTCIPVRTSSPPIDIPNSNNRARLTRAYSNLATTNTTHPIDQENEVNGSGTRHNTTAAQTAAPRFSTGTTHNTNPTTPTTTVLCAPAPVSPSSFSAASFLLSRFATLTDTDLGIDDDDVLVCGSDSSDDGGSGGGGGGDGDSRAIVDDTCETSHATVRFRAREQQQYAQYTQQQLTPQRSTSPKPLARSLPTSLTIPNTTTTHTTTRQRPPAGFGQQQLSVSASALSPCRLLYSSPPMPVRKRTLMAGAPKRGASRLSLSSSTTNVTITSTTTPPLTTPTVFPRCPYANALSWQAHPSVALRA
eukprot:TRINITY_DN1687_c0_g1_i4.p1 TRINITY_DN1687_c0_g1~~TRINITY_DN1687_c0_g1_i4.p1  ORF type:complete len:369 (+),score=82.46 TRINITY_DN1687_c0_g1_i4:65-1171(+)